MADYQTFVDGNGEQIKNGFQDAIKELLGRKIEGDGLSNESNPATYQFIKNLSHKLGWGYSDYDPYINGNYAVFMDNGPWLQYAEESKSYSHMKYISYLDDDKTENSNLNKLFAAKTKTDSALNFSQSITDIDIPEPTKEYIAVSTRQKNSFVNTRDFAGSDFNITYVENRNLDVFKYHEIWHKSIELIREGLLYVPEKSDKSETDPYVIPNPYSNAVYILLFKSKTYEVTGLIVLFGVMPVNLPFKNLVGDRGGPKVATYTMNYKFMDMQYAFYDNWEKFHKSAKNPNTIANLFVEAVGITTNSAT